MTPDLIRRIKESLIFPDLQEYIVGKILELNSLKAIKTDTLTNEQAGEEAKIRAMTVKKLEEILEPFITYSEKKEPTIAEIQKAKDRAGL